jgi:hypothetical protein
MDTSTDLENFFSGPQAKIHILGFFKDFPMDYYNL